VKHAPLFLLATLVVLTAAKRASTQNGATPHPATESFVLGPAGSTIAPKTHAPFSARLVEQRDQTLDDGTHISRSNDEIACAMAWVGFIERTGSKGQAMIATEECWSR
jgi:hypothetical protein